MDFWSILFVQFFRVRVILLQSLFEPIIDARLGLGNSEGLFPYKNFSLSSSSSFGHQNGLKYFLKEHFQREGLTFL